MDAPIDSRIYEGLLSLLGNEFPKACGKCRREYPTLQSFIGDTLPVTSGTGLMDYGSAGETGVAMMRNCACGSTMSTFCSDRRDTSEAGSRRRAMFEDLLDQLQSSGLDVPTARHQLRAFLRGERSPVLEQFGFPLASQIRADWTPSRFSLYR